MSPNGNMVQTTKNVPKGFKLSKAEMDTIAKEAEEQHSTQHTRADRERHSAMVFRTIANEVVPDSVRMKEDVPANHPSGLLPILDTQVKMVGKTIIHHHFSKPMASLEVVLGRSAMSMGSKLTILTQEACRRVNNFSLALPWELKLAEINHLMVQMRWGGYS